jgi:hypothetical protein
LGKTAAAVSISGCRFFLQVDSRWIHYFMGKIKATAILIQERQTEKAFEDLFENGMTLAF